MILIQSEPIDKDSVLSKIKLIDGFIVEANKHNQTTEQRTILLLYARIYLLQLYDYLRPIPFSKEEKK